MSVFDGIQIPKVIFETQSKYNGNIQVVQVGSTRKVKADKFEQSVNHTSENAKRLFWGRAAEIIKDEEPTLKNILLLGLGGGTVAHLISESFNQPEIVSVEIDPIMVEVARNYFDLDKIPNHRVIVDDALRVVVEPETYGLAPGYFQAVFVDLFVGEKYPDLGSSGNFISAVKRMATSGGLVVFNRHYTVEHQDEANSFVDSISNFLSGVKCQIVAGHTNSDNILIYGRA